MDGVRTHRHLDVWKEAMDLAKEVYSLTKDFPKEEIHGLGPQTRHHLSKYEDGICEYTHELHGGSNEF